MHLQYQMNQLAYKTGYNLKELWEVYDEYSKKFYRSEAYIDTDREVFQELYNDATAYKLDIKPKCKGTLKKERGEQV